MQEVIFKIRGTLGEIILNRPEKINSLTHGMIRKIDEKLQEWENDENIKMVLLYGAGERGFCAGGDMRVYYDNRDNALDLAKRFFPAEYMMDLRIIKYPKPVIAFLDGIVMGGGVGISYGARYKVVTERTKWSMPEVNIGFFPDVGASYFLNRIPKHMAKYIALLGKFLDADDVCYLGYGDYKIASGEFMEIRELLAKEPPGAVFERYAQVPGKSSLEKDKEKIEKYFSGESLEEIYKDLEKGIELGDPWAAETYSDLRKKSVFSQKIIIEQLKRAEKLSVEECFEMEKRISFSFMDNPDFFEGLRSVLVDKNKPEWKYRFPEDVPEEEIESYFNEKRPL